MNPLLILLAGMVVVVGGILVLRLNAFLALIAGALVVAVLTPASYVYRAGLHEGELDVLRVEPDGVIVLQTRAKLAKDAELLVLRPITKGGAFTQPMKLWVLSQNEMGDVRALAIAPAPVSNARLAPGDIIVEPTTEATARRASRQSIGERVAAGFGNMAVQIGILIAMAAILGRTLTQSGAAERIVVTIQRLVGEQRAGLAFGISAFILASLVLAEPTFLLLMPLAQVMRLRSGRDYTLYVLAIVAGATMTHSLVPPAAGPSAVAAELRVNLATMIAGGIIVGGISAAAGYLYGVWANRRWDIPVRGGLGVTAADLQTSLERDVATLPPLPLAIVPVVLPVLLIAANAIITDIRGSAQWTGAAGASVATLRAVGDKNVAIGIAAGIGLILAAIWGRGPVGLTNDASSRRDARQKSARAIGDALAGAGVMVLIISAGGAFGYCLRQTDIAATVQELLPVNRLALIPLAFLMATALRTAQGSAMVAMITTAGIVSPLAAVGNLGYHPVYLALAIGCGSKPFMWMNDAGFWVIGRTSGFTETETLKTASLAMSVMAIVGLLATMAGAWLLPMG